MIQTSKRKLPRRELPYIGTLLDKLSYSKLPTNKIVLKRLYCITELNNGSSSTADAAVAVKDELKSLWEYAGYGDILMKDGNIVKQVKALHEQYKKLNKTPVERRQKDSFKNKEADLVKSLELLFDVTVKSLHSSSLITDQDRDFLLNHWNKTISSVSDQVRFVIYQLYIRSCFTYLL